MAASAIDTPGASVRLLGFPLLDQFPQSRDSGPDVAARARQYAGSAPFETMRGVGALQMFASFDDALADADGAVRKDFRMTDEAIPFERRTLGERIVGVGQEVCALGRYDAEKRALVPSGATLNRLWPGTPAKVRREIVATARSQAVLGLTFFAVSHAMLGGGVLSERDALRTASPRISRRAPSGPRSRTTTSPRSSASSARAPTRTRATRSAMPCSSTCGSRRWPRRSSGSAPT